MKYKLDELIDTISDTRKIEKDKVVLINTSDVLNGKVLNHSYTSNNNLKGQFKKRFQKDDILYSEIRPGNRRFAYVDFDSNDYIASTKLMVLRNKGGIVDNDFLYLILSNKKFTNDLQFIAEQRSGTFPQITFTELSNIEVDIPDLETQKKIVRILSALDQKIELNNQQNETLFELGRQLYIEKFENNQTIDKVELGNFFPVITGKKDANASSENGKYPFFTCSKTISKIDDYVFDASAILLAGNGDFNVKFYRGKFDAYQRTYVLIPNNPEYLGFLYWAISYNLPKITANYRGSVIKFITKDNIESFKVPFADNKYIPAFMKYLERIEKNNQQNKVLAGLRDALLPKLMSGEINLNEATINE